MILISSQTFCLNGNTIKAGEYIRTGKPDLFISKGLCRRFTRGEAKNILNEYAAEVERVFHGKTTSTPARPEQEKLLLQDWGTKHERQG